MKSSLSGGILSPIGLPETLGPWRCPRAAAYGLLTPEADWSATVPTCARCKTQETQLYENGVPVCPGCANGSSIKSSATERENGAVVLRRMLRAVSASQASPGMHHSDRAQRIRDASNRLSMAREEMMDAHSRLPEDLKRAG